MYTDLKIIFGIIGLIIAGVITFVVMDTKAQKACLSRGYSSYSIAWFNEVYCIKRVNQTDVVVPLGSIP